MHAPLWLMGLSACLFPLLGMLCLDFTCRVMCTVQTSCFFLSLCLWQSWIRTSLLTSLPPAFPPLPAVELIFSLQWQNIWEEYSPPSWWSQGSRGEAAAHSASVVRKVGEEEGSCSAFCSFRKGFIQNPKKTPWLVCVCEYVKVPEEARRGHGPPGAGVTGSWATWVGAGNPSPVPWKTSASSSQMIHLSSPHSFLFMQCRTAAHRIMLTTSSLSLPT